MRRRLVIILFVMMFVLSGCSAAANQQPMEAPSVGEGAAPAAMPEMDRPEEYSASDSYTSGSVANQAPTSSDRDCRPQREPEYRRRGPGQRDVENQPDV